MAEITVPRPPQQATIDPDHPRCVWLPDALVPIVAPDELTARRLAVAWNAAEAPAHDREKAAHEVLDVLRLRHPRAGADLTGARDVVRIALDVVRDEQWARLDAPVEAAR